MYNKTISKELKKIANEVQSSSKTASIKNTDVFDIDYILDDVEFDIEQTEDFSKAEIIADHIGNDWRAYNAREIRSVAIVKRMKGRGFPDYDEIIKEIAEQENMDEDEVRENISENDFDQLFWDIVQFRMEDLSYDVFAYGRMGGQWGIPYDEDMWILNEDKIEEMVNNIDLDEFINIKSESNQREILEELEKQGIDEKDIFEKIMENYDLEDFIIVDNETISKFKKIDKEIESLISDMESTDMWVDTIRANDWHI